MELDISSPMNGATIAEAKMQDFQAHLELSPAEQAAFVSVELNSSVTGILPVRYDSARGVITASLADLPNQDQTLTLIARIAPDIQHSVEVQLTRDCMLALDFADELDEDMWLIKGSAFRDPRGWLEMTNDQRSVVGGMFLIGAPFSPGDLDVSFRIAAGACDELGACPGQEIADGYAMSVWNLTTDQIDRLWAITGVSGNGASISATRLMENGWPRRPEGITVEFDTYPNRCPNNGYFDPIQGPHVEIYFNGQYTMYDDMMTREERCMNDMPGANFPDYWRPAPSIVDNQWHDVHITIQDNRIRVSIDEELFIDADVPDFTFKGGLLAFSGGSGAVTAFQRFDDLIIGSACN